MTWSFPERKAAEEAARAFLDKAWSAWWGGSVPTEVAEERDDLAGVDVWLRLPWNDRFPVQEKVRFREYGDVLIEFVGNSVRSTLGWALKQPASRLVLYAVEPSGRALVFPSSAVHRATTDNLGKWIVRHGIKRTPNEGYSTLNVPVPTHEFRALIDQSHGIQECRNCGTPSRWSERRGGGPVIGCTACRPDGADPWRIQCRE